MLATCYVYMSTCDGFEITTGLQKFQAVSHYTFCSLFYRTLGLAYIKPRIMTVKSNMNQGFLTFECLPVNHSA